MEQRSNHEHPLVRFSEDQLKTILDAFPDAIDLIDVPSRKIIYQNRKSIELHGGRHTGDLEKARRKLDLRKPDGRKYALDELPSMRSIKEGVTVQNEEMIIERDDGEHLTILVSSAPIYSEDGKMTTVAVTLNDITQRKRVEAELAESEERYRLIYEHSLNGILFTRPQGAVLGANAAAQRILGMTEAEIIEGGRSAVMDESDERAEIALKQRAELGTFTGELRYKRKDGTVFPVEITSSIFKDRKGETFSSVIFQDITWRKKAEDILKESEQRFRELAEAMPQLVWTVTSDGNFMDYANGRIDLFDSVVQDESGNWNPFGSFHPDDLEKTKLAWFQAFKEKSEHKVEHRIKHKDGSYRWYLTQARPIKDSQGNIIKWIGITTDINDVKEAEEKLKEQKAQLENANNELESFSYSVSHDLRAPLRAIDGFSRMLSKKAERMDDESLHRIQVIRSSVKKMESLIDDLLSFSRYARAELSKGSIDMNDVVEEVTGTQSQTIGDRAIEFRIEKLPNAMGDVGLIERVWSNLIANAVKFTRNRKKAIIEIGAKKEGRTIVYYVKDNGAGFDMKNYDRLFAVFQRLHREDEFEGTGIGLPIVQRIVSRHCGQVWAEGKIDEGATFYFRLPANYQKRKSDQ